MQNHENLHACSCRLGSNCIRLAAKLQTLMQNLHALAAIAMQSRWLFSMTLGEQISEEKIETQGKKS